MAKQGDGITNYRTGQRMVFLRIGKETNGKLLEIDTFNPKTNMREPIHIHPKQESSAEVISGKLHFNLFGTVSNMFSDGLSKQLQIKKSHLNIIS